MSAAARWWSEATGSSSRSSLPAHGELVLRTLCFHPPGIHCHDQDPHHFCLSPLRIRCADHVGTNSTRSGCVRADERGHDVRRLRQADGQTQPRRRKEQPVAILILRVGVLTSFIAVHLLGMNSNLKGLCGIAIMIGTMVDAAIAMLDPCREWSRPRSSHCRSSPCRSCRCSSWNRGRSGCSSRWPTPRPSRWPARRCSW